MGASTTGARESRSDRRSRRIWPSTPVARRQFGARPAFTADEAVNAGRAAKSRADRRDRSTRRSMPSARRRYPPRLRALTPPRTGPPPGPPVNAAVHRARGPPREPAPRPVLPSMPQFNGPDGRRANRRRARTSRRCRSSTGPRTGPANRRPGPDRPSMPAVQRTGRPPRGTAPLRPDLSSMPRFNKRPAARSSSDRGSERNFKRRAAARGRAGARPRPCRPPPASGRSRRRPRRAPAASRWCVRGRRSCP